MYVDLSPLESLGKTAVRCKTEEFAQMFVDAMWEQYPKKMDGIWGRKTTITGIVILMTQMESVIYTVLLTKVTELIIVSLQVLKTQLETDILSWSSKN